MPKVGKSGKDEATPPQSPVRSPPSRYNRRGNTSAHTPPPLPLTPRAFLRPFYAPTTFVPFMRAPVADNRPLASTQRFAAVVCMS